MGRFKHIFVIVVNSFGAGSGRDTKACGDEGTNTVGHIVESVGHWEVPSLQKLRVTDMHPLRGVVSVERSMGYHTVMDEDNCGKDTTTGHWELMGTKTVKPFVIFTEAGFPKELIEELEGRIGHKVIGNKSLNGTTTLDELTEEKIATGHVVVYISADPVLQICGNEEVLELDELYRCCEIAREPTMKNEWRVERVTVRPYVGKKKGEFKRASNRHNYVLKPTGKVALDTLKERGLEVTPVGKIRDIFSGEGTTKAYKSKSSVHDMEQIIDTIKDGDFEGLCFVNLADFDALWGHRRSPQGYAKEVETFDVELEEALADLREDDLLIIAADYGNDPTYSGTDHTEEQVPFLIYSKQSGGSGALKETDTFAAVRVTITENLGVRVSEGTIRSLILGQLS